MHPCNVFAANYHLVIVFDPVLKSSGNSSHKNFRYVAYNMIMDVDKSSDIFGTLTVVELILSPCGTSSHCIVVAGRRGAGGLARARLGTRREASLLRDGVQATLHAARAGGCAAR